MIYLLSEVFWMNLKYCFPILYFHFDSLRSSNSILRYFFSNSVFSFCKKCKNGFKGSIFVISGHRCKRVENPGRGYWMFLLKIRTWGPWCLQRGIPCSYMSLAKNPGWVGGKGSKKAFKPPPPLPHTPLGSCMTRLVFYCIFSIKFFENLKRNLLFYTPSSITACSQSINFVEKKVEKVEAWNWTCHI